MENRNFNNYSQLIKLPQKEKVLTSLKTIVQTGRMPRTGIVKSPYYNFNVSSTNRDVIDWIQKEYLALNYEQGAALSPASQENLRQRRENLEEIKRLVAIKTKLDTIYLQEEIRRIFAKHLNKRNNKIVGSSRRMRNESLQTPPRFLSNVTTEPLKELSFNNNTDKQTYQIDTNTSVKMGGPFISLKTQTSPVATNIQTRGMAVQATGYQNLSLNCTLDHSYGTPPCLPPCRSTAEIPYQAKSTSTSALISPPAQCLPITGSIPATTVITPSIHCLSTSSVPTTTFMTSPTQCLPTTASVPTTVHVTPQTIQDGNTTVYQHLAPPVLFFKNHEKSSGFSYLISVTDSGPKVEKVYFETNEDGDLCKVPNLRVVKPLPEAKSSASKSIQVKEEYYTDDVLSKYISLSPDRIRSRQLLKSDAIPQQEIYLQDPSNGTVKTFPRRFKSRRMREQSKVYFEGLPVIRSSRPFLKGVAKDEYHCEDVNDDKAYPRTIVDQKQTSFQEPLIRQFSRSSRQPSLNQKLIMDTVEQEQYCPEDIPINKSLFRSPMLEQEYSVISSTRSSRQLQMEQDGYYPEKALFNEIQSGSPSRTLTLTNRPRSRLILEQGPYSKSFLSSSRPVIDQSTTTKLQQVEYYPEDLRDTLVRRFFKFLKQPYSTQRLITDTIAQERYYSKELPANESQTRSSSRYSRFRNESKPSPMLEHESTVASFSRPSGQLPSLKESVMNRVGQEYYPVKTSIDKVQSELFLKVLEFSSSRRSIPELEQSSRRFSVTEEPKIEHVEYFPEKASIEENQLRFSSPFTRLANKSSSRPAVDQKRKYFNEPSVRQFSGSSRQPFFDRELAVDTTRQKQYYPEQASADKTQSRSPSRFSNVLDKSKVKLIFRDPYVSPSSSLQEQYYPEEASTDEIQSRSPSKLANALDDSKVRLIFREPYANPSSGPTRRLSTVDESIVNRMEHKRYYSNKESQSVSPSKVSAASNKCRPMLKQQSVVRNVLTSSPTPQEASMNKKQRRRHYPENVSFDKTQIWSVEKLSAPSLEQPFSVNEQEFSLPQKINIDKRQQTSQSRTSTPLNKLTGKLTKKEQPSVKFIITNSFKKPNMNNTEQDRHLSEEVPVGEVHFRSSFSTLTNKSGSRPTANRKKTYFDKRLAKYSSQDSIIDNSEQEEYYSKNSPIVESNYRPSSGFSTSTKKSRPKPKLEQESSVKYSSKLPTPIQFSTQQKSTINRMEPELSYPGEAAFNETQSSRVSIRSGKSRAMLEQEPSSQELNMDNMGTEDSLEEDPVDKTYYKEPFHKSFSRSSEKCPSDQESHRNGIEQDDSCLDVDSTVSYSKVSKTSLIPPKNDAETYADDNNQSSDTDAEWPDMDKASQVEE